MKNKYFLLLLLLFFSIIFVSCDLENSNDNSVNVDLRKIESPIDFEFKLTGDTYDLEYLDMLNLEVSMENNIDKDIDINYQIGYNYLILEDDSKENNGTKTLKDQEIYYDFYPFRVDSLDYNLEEINLDYYYCYNYDYEYDLYLEMYKDGQFISNNLITDGLNDMTSNVIIDQVEVKYVNGKYRIYIYLNENKEYDQSIVLNVNNQCRYDYNDKNKLYYLVKIGDQELNCKYNYDSKVDGKEIATLSETSDVSRISCEYENEEEISLNLNVYLEYAVIGEYKNRLGVKVE